jgi:hypothetical protein
MTQGKDTKKQIARLEQVLDTFGANPARWPVSDRAALEVLVETQHQARRLLDEAQALERVMDVAPMVKASDALKARIVTAAINDPEREASVVPISASPDRPEYSLRARRAALMWPAAALAASFAFGLYLGVSGVGGQAFEDAFQISAISGSGGDADTISWLDDSNGSDAEDLL